MLTARFNDFLNQNFDKAISSGVALAVSGGSDSIALLFLASKWTIENSVRLVVLSVDHKLRAESALESEFVKKTTLGLGHEFVPLSWEHDGQKTSIQERARAARYNMMTEKCHELSIKTLLTAHHYDDFLENYLMRKRKKSGSLGLSNNCAAFFNDIQVLRPFYNTEKGLLVEYLQANRFDWMEDQSNSSDLYERNRVRKQVEDLSEEDKSSLEEEMKAVNVRAEVLNNNFIKEIAENVSFNNFGFAFIKLDSYQQIDYEIAIYLINFVLTSVSGKTETPRYRSVKKLLEKINSGDGFDCSLHGCILRRVNDKILIFREVYAIDKKHLSLLNNVIWDGRFKFDVNDFTNNSNYKIEQLCMQDYIKIKADLDMKELAELSANNHKDILFTLPVIKNLEKIVAIPHISYYDDFESGFEVNVIFRSGFISRFTHFL